MTGDVTDGHPEVRSSVGEAANVTQYLDVLLRTLWPAPAKVEYNGRRAQPGPAGRELLVVPSLSRPKLLVPRRPRRAAAAAMRNYKASAEGRTRLALRVIAAAVRVGLGEVLPHRVRIDSSGAGRSAGIDGYLAEALGQQLEIGLYIGPPRAVQKPILQLIDARGKTLAFAKIGVTPFTRELVRREAESLTFLASRSWHHLTVPRVVHHAQWGEHEVLVQEALQRARPSRNAAIVVSAAMVELSECRGYVERSLGVSDYWNRLRARVTGLPSGTGPGMTVASAVAHLESTSMSRELAFGSWHGDWTAWNMTTSHTDVMVWDWEQFESGVPVGFDALHYAIQNAVVMGGLSPAQAFDGAARDCPVLLDPFGVSTANARVTLLLYTLEIATRYLEAGESGTVMAQLDTWLEKVVEQQLLTLGREQSDA